MTVSSETRCNNPTGTKHRAVHILLAVIPVTAVTTWLAMAHFTAEATIDWTDVRQTMGESGGAVADFETGLTSAQADFFFTPAGIGLPILLAQIIPDEAMCEAGLLKGVCDDTNGQILNGELRSVQLAVARIASAIISA